MFFKINVENRFTIQTFKMVKLEFKHSIRPLNDKATQIIKYGICPKAKATSNPLIMKICIELRQLESEINANT